MASVEMTMQAPLDVVWQVCTDLEHCADYIESIVSVDIVDRNVPELFAKGTTWDETREMFGTQAKERMWIESVSDQSSYVVAAESCGAKYSTVFEFEEVEGNQTLVRCSFDAKPLTWCAWLMNLLMAPLMASTMRKGLLKDLGDIAKEAKSRTKAK
eukprot:CAMPEP_0202829402 /NCGR_PEP_ID=MMETSP1389-20130828/15496_1 /ASSEMBLY_ACC=CAM_ASM_000865 /TAXON_ID=302021 /ORGANISM="Rhodomonas sp., Strain CCMP768" /LENGTH=155 /DNA_ID=CAMNT_0049502951 /DNA_START=10 /DNA_END=480 /DNA_ORIENTATION=+